jgi:ABC-type dipeptide/oligopeptide/nickel transport system permease subunit
MIQEESMNTGISEAPPRISESRRFYRVFFSRDVVIFGPVIVLLFILTAAFAPWISPYDPYKQNLKEVLAQPSTTHLLGTDWLSRDTMSRLIYGSRTSNFPRALREAH